MGAVLCIVGYLAAFLASTHQMLVDPRPKQNGSTQNDPRHRQMSPGTKLPPLEDHCCAETAHPGEAQDTSACKVPQVAEP